MTVGIVRHGAMSAARNPGRLRALREDAAFAAAVASVAAVAGYAVAGSITLAAGTAALGLVLWLATHLRVAAVVLGASVPFAGNLVGSSFGGLNAAASDLVLVVMLVGILLEAAVRGRLHAASALRPVLIPVAVYAGVMAVLLAYHLSVASGIKTGQRLELFAIPLLVGAYVAQNDAWLNLLRAYVISCAVVAVLWPVFHNADESLGIQKNPAGQFICNAILLVIAVRALRRYALLLPLLAFGLIFTQSRGAILATGIGISAVLLAQGAASFRLLLARVLPLLVLVAGAYFLLPKEAQERTTNFESGTATTGEYAVLIRDLYRQDAEALIREHPWFGVGVGQYRAGTQAGGDISTDPHQVLLFQRAEGGPFLEIAFVILIAGSVAAIAFTRLRRTALGPAAMGVTVAIAGHGLVDVYWVRATPVLGWLLVGMACGLAAEARAERS